MKALPMKIAAHATGLTFGVALMLAGCAGTREAQFGNHSTPQGMFSGPQVTMDVARLYETQGSFDRAEAGYRELMRKSPDQVGPVHRLGVLAVRQGKLDEAERLFGQAMTLAPPEADLLTDAGYLYFLQNRHNEAETLLRQSLAKAPGNQRTLNNLGLVLARLDREQEALNVFKQAKGQSDAHTSLGFALAQGGQIDKAQFHLGRALDIDPDNRPAAEGLVEIASRRGMRAQSPAGNDPFQGGSVQNQVAGTIRRELPRELAPTQNTSSDDSTTKQSDVEYTQSLMARLSPGNSAKGTAAGGVDPFTLKTTQPASPTEPREVKQVAAVAAAVDGNSLFQIESGRRDGKTVKPIAVAQRGAEKRGTENRVDLQSAPRTILVTQGSQTRAVEIRSRAGDAVETESRRAGSKNTGQLTTVAYAVDATVAGKVTQASGSDAGHSLPDATGAEAGEHRTESTKATISERPPVAQKIIDRLVTVLDYGEPSEQRRAIRDVPLLDAQSDEILESLTRLANEGSPEVQTAAHLVLAEWSHRKENMRR